MTGAFFCSECGYENVVAGCGFCLQCGAEFNPEDHQAAIASAANEAAGPPPAEIAEAIQPASAAQESQQVSVPASVGAGVAEAAAPVQVAPQAPQSQEYVQLSAHPDAVAISRGGTIDFQSAIATAEQCDFESGGHWDEVDPHAIGGSVEAGAPGGQAIAVEQAAAVPHIQVQQPAAQPAAVQPVHVEAPVEPPPEPVAAAPDTPPAPQDQDEFSEVLDDVSIPVAAAPAVAVAAAAAAAVVATPPATPPAAEAPPASGDDETVAEEVEETFAESLLREMNAAIVSAAGLVNMKVREDGDRLVAQLLIDGRPQLVFIERTVNSQETPILSMYAVCGPASADNAMPLLEWNRALNMCGFAVREVGEKKMFVIQSNVLAYAVDQTLLSKTLVEIAKRANQVNERLIG